MGSSVCQMLRKSAQTRAFRAFSALMTAWLALARSARALAVWLSACFSSRADRVPILTFCRLSASSCSASANASDCTFRACRAASSAYQAFSTFASRFWICSSRASADSCESSRAVAIW